MRLISLVAIVLSVVLVIGVTAKASAKVRVLANVWAQAGVRR